MLNTSRISAAFALAAKVHASQNRKGTTVPYISHPMAVAAQVLVWGGSEDQFIAALLHDVVEDGGAQYKDEILAEFGEDVLGMVLACSDAEPMAGEKKAPWLDRKRYYVEHLETAREDALIVSAADKWHNLQSILADVRKTGNGVFSRFVKEEPDPLKKKALTLWYYRSLLGVYSKRNVRGSDEIRQLIDEIVRETSFS